mmetsp:Transcript_14142/g.35939  ORF Transcript_14142/g.35939 Transcript_14142/m.35939 type:complete len:234 (+) Transcript_14142:1034-1735(+)
MASSAGSSGAARRSASVSAECASFATQARARRNARRPWQEPCAGLRARARTTEKGARPTPAEAARRRCAVCGAKPTVTVASSSSSDASAARSALPASGGSGESAVSDSARAAAAPASCSPSPSRRSSPRSSSSTCSAAITCTPTLRSNRSTTAIAPGMLFQPARCALVRMHALSSFAKRMSRKRSLSVAGCTAVSLSTTVADACELSANKTGCAGADSSVILDTVMAASSKAA